MILEVSGMPGVGKSTVIKKLLSESNINDKSIVFDIREYILKNKKVIFDSILYYDFIILSKIYLLKKKDLFILRKSLPLTIRSENTFLNKINILRNVLKKIIIYRYAINKKQIFIIDESITHILFNLFVGNEKKYDRNKISLFHQILPLPNKILIVDAPDNIIKSRILDRGEDGHRRIDFSNQKRFQNFMSQSRNVIEVIKDNKNAVVFQNISKTVDLKDLLQKLDI